MSLTAYKKKRQFKDNPEPAGKKVKKEDKKLRFVVQRHHATQLHYDFRLEMEGVLKSWAVPKGPSLNPSDKRLAMMVEDHPYEYKDFEGTIPKGNYGAGVVYKWDEGFYEPINGSGSAEKELLKELESGSLKFILRGKKLRGEFALVKMKGKEDNAWLLIKHKDKFSTEKPYDSEDVVPPAVKEKKNNKAPVKSRGKSKPVKSSMIKPMFARLTDKPFSREGWLFENKWDGYRAIADIKKGDVQLYSRNGQSFNDDYKPVVQALAKIGHDVVLDGEVVALNSRKKPDFQLLQNYKKSKKGTLVYYAFDLLALNGHDLADMELIQRKELLDELFKNLRGGIILNTEYILTEGEKYFKKISKEKGEGLIAKLCSSTYQPGRRTDNWLKIKTHKQQEALIAGFTAPRGSRKKFGALILALREKDHLKYIGHTGGGFDQHSLENVYNKMLPFIREECPFKKAPKTNAPATWLKPELICEVKFSEWTGDGHMRQPIFIALRTDKSPEMIVHEKPVKPRESGKAGNPAVKKKTRTTSKEEKRTAGTGTKKVPLSNLDKLYWPKEKISKGDLVNYYGEMAGYILPYLKDRPESLHRHPDGIGKPSFYQKDFDLKNAPGWLKTIPILSESTNKEIDYLICNNEATLLYMANLGCIEINPWLARHPRIDYPDYIAIDLDPEKIPFKAVVETALAVKEVLDDLKLTGFCKTSGATGLHIYIPLIRRYTFEVSRMAAKFIAQKTHEKLPKITSLARSPSSRQRKVYVDYLQNSRGQTLAAPYSVRPRPKATVSAPLEWAELNDDLDPVNFTLHTIRERVEEKGDLWKDLLKTKNSLKHL